MEPDMGISRRSVLFGMLAAAAAGCTTDVPESSPSNRPESAAPATPEPTPTPTPDEFVDPTPRWPLTGVPLEDGEAELAAHPAVAVKPAVEKRSFPQYGVEDADIVFWEAQGNSYDITRLCAIYHSKWPKDGVQPIRSARPVDLHLVAPLKGVLASASATEWVMKYIRNHSDVVEYRVKYGDSSNRWGMRAPGGWWKGSNATDKKVVAYPEHLAADAKISKGEIPPTYFQYAAGDDEVSTVNGTPATEVKLQYPTTTIGNEWHKWEWNAEKGVWEASVRFYEGKTWYEYTVRSGKRIGVPNVLVVFCKWKMGVVKGYGTKHKEPLYSMGNGKDKFIYFHDGKYVTGTWTKAKFTERFVFKLDDGSFLKMAPGQTWVELPQHDADIRIA
jgi:hypothetical protein